MEDLQEVGNIDENDLDEYDDFEFEDEDVAVDENFTQFLTFSVCGETYGLDVLRIIEVREFENVFNIPNVPDYIMGVINLRGTVVPVIDLSHRFLGKKSEITRLSCIIIVEVEDEGGKVLIGASIDAVKAVSDILDDDINPAPDFGSSINANFISGIGKIHDKFVIILDIDKVLNLNELSEF